MVDALLKLAYGTRSLTKGIMVQTLCQRSIHKDEMIVIFLNSTWMGDIIHYLKTKDLSDDPNQARKI